MGKMKIMATMACTTMLVACNQQKGIEHRLMNSTDECRKRNASHS